MKIGRLVILSVVAVAILSAVIVKSRQRFDTSFVMGANGLTSLKCNDVEFLENGEFQVKLVTLRRPNGETYQGSTTGAIHVDQAKQELMKTLPWGKVNVKYKASKNQLTFTISTTNTSASDTIQGVLYEPLTLKFPAKVKEYDNTTPLLAHSIGDVAVVRLSYGTGSVAVVNDDVDKPLMVGVPWANNRPTDTVFPLSVHTDRVRMYPDSYPVISRPIPPNGSDQYHVSLRFGGASATDIELASDVYKKFSEVFPSQLKWPDRRPIGAIFLATDSQYRQGNPRGWFGDASLNLAAPSGRETFKQRMLARADESIANMQDMKAQGVITWDIEGQEFARSVGYVGDPRMVNDLAPEMGEVVDEYFSRFRNAGLRVGICVRPQQFFRSPDRKTATQSIIQDPVKILVEKIRYAKERWGVTLAYIDSNTTGKDPNPMDAALMQKVATALPDVLLIPEHSNFRYYSFSAPFRELRQGYVSTPDAVHAAYPNAFTLIYTADGPLDLYHNSLAAAVKRGDSLMYRAWYADPQNEKVKSLVRR